MLPCKQPMVNQAALRFNIRRGVVVIPKSVHKERIQQNFAVWDFKLSDEDMKKIDALDIGHSEITDHFAGNVQRNMNLAPVFAF